jgi:hypothetical protein
MSGPMSPIGPSRHFAALPQLVGYRECNGLAGDRLEGSRPQSRN